MGYSHEVTKSQTRLSLHTGLRMKQRLSSYSRKKFKPNLHKLESEIFQEFRIKRCKLELFENCFVFPLQFDTIKFPEVSLLAMK